MAEKITCINNQILKWARLDSGYDIDAMRSKCPKWNIEGWEKAEDFPTYTQLRDLMQIYRKPIAIVFFPQPPVLKDLKTSFRTLPVECYSIFTPQLISLLNHARGYQLNLYELHDNQNPNINKFHDLQSSSQHPKSFPKEVRSALFAPLAEQFKIQNATVAFDYWREKLLELGIYVFMDAFKIEEISGFCLYDEKFPIIYINNSTSNYRQVFSLFHELYHLLSGDGGITLTNDTELERFWSDKDKIIERNSNNFAGSFLVPDEDFYNRIKLETPSISEITKLASLYRVSREVIARKFLDLNLLTSAEYGSFANQFNNDYLNYRKVKAEDPGGNYYNTQSKYKGKAYIDLVLSNYFSRRIDLPQTTSYLNMKIGSIQKLATKSGWGTL